MDDANVSTVPTAETPTTELDELAIKLVAIDGHRMKLKKEERLEAIRLMASRGILPQQMGWRLGATAAYVRILANNAKIELPKAVEPVHWTYDYVFARNNKQRQQELRERAVQRSRNKRRRDRNGGSDTSDNVGTTTSN